MQIYGLVRDDQDKAPLAGVKIFLKGTDLETTTNLEGRFSIEVPNPSDLVVLIFSFIGYFPQEVWCHTDGEIRISLHEDLSAFKKIN